MEESAEGWKKGWTGMKDDWRERRKVERGRRRWQGKEGWREVEESAEEWRKK